MPRTELSALCTLQHKVPISHEARQVTISDFTQFTHILAADANNLRDLKRLVPGNSTADVRLWGSYLDNKPIPDPYYGGLVRLQEYLHATTTWKSTQTYTSP